MLLSMSWIDGHASSVQKGLPRSLVSILTEQTIPPETLTVIVQAVDSDESIISLNSKTLRSPASLTKLFTTFIALDYLGPDFQWHTKFMLPIQYLMRQLITYCSKEKEIRT